jgi:hypothetical protein
MAANNHTGNNKTFDIHVVDLMEMDEVIPRAVSADARQWAENCMETARNAMNEAINSFCSVEQTIRTYVC